MSTQTDKLTAQHVSVDVAVGGTRSLHTTEASAADLLAGIGATTDAPVAVDGADEGATERSGISLWKRIANGLKSIAASLAGTLTVSGAVTTSGTVTEASAADILTAVEALASQRQVGVGATAVGDTSTGNAAPCATDQACLYAIVAAPTALDAAAANTAEVRVAVVASGTLAHAGAVAQGRTLSANNYEGVVVACTNTNQLRFASATASTSVNVYAVTAV